MADSYAGLLLQLASTMIISRILSPAEVGIVAIAAVFSMLASMLRDFGVAEFLIQERDLTKEKLAATLALNIIVSWLMAAAMFFGASGAASFYGNAGVAEVMRIQAIGFLLVPFGAVTMAWFRREMNFMPITVCSLAGNVTSFTVSIAMVLHGFGYVSLPWANVASIAVTVVLSAWYRPGNFPRFPSFKGIGHVFRFSKFVSLMYIVGQIGRGAPELIIGRAQGVVAVGIFSRASGLVELFNRTVMRPVWFVCMPYFAKAERSDGSMAAAYAKSVAYTTVMGWPFLALLALAAFPAIRIVYGPQWDAAVPLAQILCAARAIELVHTTSREALLAKGLAKDANWLQLVLVLVLAAGLMLVVPFGLYGAAWGCVAAAAASTALSHHYVATRIGVRTADLLRACVPSATITVLSVAAASLWALLDPPSPQGYLAYGMGATALTVVSWLFAVVALKHPVVRELEPVMRKLMAWRRPA